MSMPCENAKLFDKGKLSSRTDLGALTPFDDTLLRARGFDESGNRIGGIVAPIQVTLPSGAVLVRTFGGAAKPIGQWWLTLHELAAVMAYIGHSDFAEGRLAGKGVLHAFLAVLRREWNNTCAFFTVVQIQRPLCALYGDGDHVTYGATGGRKAALILDKGSQRSVRQVMIPKLWEYESAVIRRIQKADTDRQLAAVTAQFATGTLPFEA